MGRLDNKVTIITGGGSGMGEATSILFAKEGAKVVVADINAKGGEKVVKTIKANGGKAVFVKVDVSKAEDAKKMVQTAVETYGRLDVLFNNAGILGSAEPALTADFKEEDFDRTMAVNFKGAFLCTKYAIPEMLKSGGGSLIFTSSEAAVQACKGAAVYSASKGAVLSFARSVAMEYCRKGIRSNIISPGPTKTPLVDAVTPPDIDEILAGILPMGRRAVPQDIAYCALFFASDESKYINAANLMADGGYSVRGGGA
jgi:NAD(P)-dependent dehydrogenase (short-subunit alcohol dehydrogenase family)